MRGDATHHDPVAALLAAARRARCRDAEVYLKRVRVRQVASEPSAESGGAPHRVVSQHAESGTALRVLDAEGREGFAWRGGGCGAAGAETGAGRGPAAGELQQADADLPAAADELLREALESARVGAHAGAAWPVGPGAAPPDAASKDAAATDCLDPVEGIVDPDRSSRPDDTLAAIAAAAVAEVAARAEGALEIDRVVVTEAATSTRLARLSGADARYERTLAAIAVAVVPAVPEADAAVEERSACRIDDLDPVAAARAAVDRALPRRPASLPEAIGGAVPAPAVSGKPRPVAVPATIILTPRAAASLWGALAPFLESGAISSGRPSALGVVAEGRAPRRPSSAPFDGAGRPTGRRVLMQSGRAVAPIDAASGPFVRNSYRELPSPGAAAILIEPGRVAEALRRTGGDTSGGETGGFALRAEVIEVRPGAGAWSIEIRRGDWCRLDGGLTAIAPAGGGRSPGVQSLGAADGLTWEGPPAAIVQAVVATLDDQEWFEVGLPVATPSVVLDGLGPWRLPESME